MSEEKQEVVTGRYEIQIHDRNTGANSRIHTDKPSDAIDALRELANKTPGSMPEIARVIDKENLEKAK